MSNISATQTHRLNASEWIIFKWAIFQLYHGVNKFLITLWRCLLVLNQNGELKFSSCGSNQRSMWDIVIDLSVIICVHWLHIQSEITRSNVTKLGRNVTGFSTLCMFSIVLKFNMAAQTNCPVWLAEFSNIFFSETTCMMELLHGINILVSDM